MPAGRARSERNALYQQKKQAHKVPAFRFCFKI